MITRVLNVQHGDKDPKVFWRFEILLESSEVEALLLLCALHHFPFKTLIKTETWGEGGGDLQQREKSGLDANIQLLRPPESNWNPYLNEQCPHFVWSREGGSLYILAASSKSIRLCQLYLDEAWASLPLTRCWKENRVIFPLHLLCVYNSIQGLCAFFYWPCIHVKRLELSLRNALKESVA